MPYVFLMVLTFIQSCSLKFIHYESGLLHIAVVIVCFNDLF